MRLTSQFPYTLLSTAHGTPSVLLSYFSTSSVATSSTASWSFEKFSKLSEAIDSQNRIISLENDKSECLWSAGHYYAIVSGETDVTNFSSTELML